MLIQVACVQTGKRRLPLDRLFTYGLPESMEATVGPGSLVLVPFGHKNQLIPACVVDAVDEPVSEMFNIKDVAEVILGLTLTSEQLALAMELREKELLTYGEAFGLFIPSGLSFKNHQRYFRTGKPTDRLKRGNLLRDELLEYIATNPGFELGDFVKQFGTENEKELSKILTNLERQEYVECQRYCDIEASQGTELNIRLLRKVAVAERFVQQKAIVDLLISWEGEGTWSDLREETGAPLSVIRSLEKSGILEVEEVEDMRLPEFFKCETQRDFHDLGEGQRAVYSTVIDALETPSKFLLHGVTGSGKTQVYIEWVREVVVRGKSALLLVPEISLTPQTCSFFSRLPDLRMAIFHSRLTPRERLDQWKLVERGEIDLVIGARSAIFAPFRRLGLIIIDEEHDASYRSDHAPRYDARGLAESLGGIFSCPVVMGSATPRLQRYHEANSREGDHLLRLRERFGEAGLPKVEVVDMREELACGNRTIFSHVLRQAVEERLSRGEQTILYLNRKGHSTFVSCRSCGYVMSCPHCDISMTYFKGQDNVKCGYCGHEAKVPQKCPSCDSKYFKFFGHGTEKIEELVKEAFPQARVARLDATVTARKGQMEKVYAAMQAGETDILVGTQLVSKGLDFEHVTLVGILSADTLLHLPDYSAAEKTFQQLTQVAGRAGRGSKEGLVILQTYKPEEKAIVTAALQDHESFCRHELPIRKMFGYPPYKDLVVLTTSSEDKNEAFEAAKYVRESVLDANFDFSNMEILGPYQNAVSRKAGRYRYQLIFKFDWGTDCRDLKNILRRITMDGKDKRIGKGVQLAVVMSPDSLLD